jgi:hypothetical protein
MKLSSGLKFNVMVWMLKVHPKGFCVDRWFPADSTVGRWNFQEWTLLEGSEVIRAVLRKRIMGPGPFLLSLHFLASPGEQFQQRHTSAMMFCHTLDPKATEATDHELKKPPKP